MRKKIAIIGGGASAMMLACELDPEKFEVAIYEKNAALGRKFLVAGEGGLNLTHSESPEHFISRYTPSIFLEKAFEYFNNKDFIRWLNNKGIETFVGSSGRIFPKKGIKPIAVLNLLLDVIKKNKVSVYTKYEWRGFTQNNDLVFEHQGQELVIKSDYHLYCLGGASWPVTGSNGNWSNYFKEKNIVVKTFEPSNCKFTIARQSLISDKIAGKALKNCSIACAGKVNPGEVVFTAGGIEGSGIYPLSPQIRQQLRESGRAEIVIDLKPSVNATAILKKLRKPRKNNSYSQHVAEALNFNQLQMTLLKNLISKEDFLDLNHLAYQIKNLRLEISGTGPLDDAISSVGGIDLGEINGQFELKKLRSHFVIGEMLDFDAPTGGYLLQSCFTMAKYLSHVLNSGK